CVVFRHAEPNASGDLDIVEAFPSLRLQLQNLASERKQGCSGWRQADLASTAAANHERQSEQAFQTVDMSADRRLRLVQSTCCFGKTLRIGNANETLQQKRIDRAHRETSLRRMLFIRNILFLYVCHKTIVAASAEM